MNPIRKFACDDDNLECPDFPIRCRFSIVTGKELNGRGARRYCCPHEWEITAVRSEKK